MPFFLKAAVSFGWQRLSEFEAQKLRALSHSTTAPATRPLAEEASKGVASDISPMRFLPAHFLMLSFCSSFRVNAAAYKKKPISKWETAIGWHISFASKPRRRFRWTSAAPPHKTDARVELLFVSLFPRESLNTPLYQAPPPSKPFVPGRPHCFSHCRNLYPYSTLMLVPARRSDM